MRGEQRKSLKLLNNRDIINPNSITTKMTRMTYSTCFSGEPFLAINSNNKEQGSSNSNKEGMLNNNNNKELINNINNNSSLKILMGMWEIPYSINWYHS